MYVMPLTSKCVMESCERAYIIITLITRYFPFFCIQFSIFLTTVMHIISVTDFQLFCSNNARKCLTLPAECSSQKSLILLEILPAEFIQAYLRCHQAKHAKRQSSRRQHTSSLRSSLRSTQMKICHFDHQCAVLRKYQICILKFVLFVSYFHNYHLTVIRIQKHDRQDISTCIRPTSSVF